MQHLALLPAGMSHLAWPQLSLPSASRRNTGCSFRGKIFGPLFIQGTTPGPLASAVCPHVVLCGVPWPGIFWCRGLSWHLRRFPIQTRTLPITVSWRSPSNIRISHQKRLLVLTFKSWRGCCDRGDAERQQVGNGGRAERGGGINGRKSFFQFCLKSALRMFLAQSLLHEPGISLALLFRNLYARSACGVDVIYI